MMLTKTLLLCSFPQEFHLIGFLLGRVGFLLYLIQGACQILVLLVFFIVGSLTI
jgi:hypothetical protein